MINNFLSEKIARREATSKLRSHLEAKLPLRKTRGFTLVELLIVIAIIAILVLIVIIAINPIERINDATDRAAQSNVRAVSTAVEGCLTANAETWTNCNTTGQLTSDTVPGGPWVREWPDVNTEVAGTDPITVCQEARSGWRAFWATNTGTVVLQETAACP